MHCSGENSTVLIFGGSGLVGRALTTAFRQRHQVTAPSRAELDVRDAGRVLEFVCDLRPRVVVNCVGFGGHDACEAEPAGAWETHVTATTGIARACSAAGATMIQISSAAVFDGTKNGPYLETDMPAPLNVYGASKLAGEAIARAVAPAAYIFRLPMLYGEPGEDSSSFIARLRSRLLETTPEPVRLAEDELTSPTPAQEAAQAVSEVVATRPPGVYHLACSGSASLYEIGVFIAKRMQSNARLTAVPAATFWGDLPRPRNGCLASVYIPSLGPWQEAIVRWLTPPPSNRGDQPKKLPTSTPRDEIV